MVWLLKFYCIFLPRAEPLINTMWFSCFILQEFCGVGGLTDSEDVETEMAKVPDQTLEILASCHALVFVDNKLVWYASLYLWSHSLSFVVLLDLMIWSRKMPLSKVYRIRISGSIFSSTSLAWCYDCYYYMLSCLWSVLSFLCALMYVGKSVSLI